MVALSVILGAISAPLGQRLCQIASVRRSLLSEGLGEPLGLNFRAARQVIGPTIPALHLVLVRDMLCSAETPMPDLHLSKPRQP